MKSPKRDMGSCHISNTDSSGHSGGPCLSGLLHEGVLAVIWVGLKRYTLFCGHFNWENYSQHCSTFLDTYSWWFVSAHSQGSGLSERGSHLFHLDLGNYPQLPVTRLIPEWSTPQLKLRQGAVLAELKAACPSSEEFIRAFANGA